MATVKQALQLWAAGPTGPGWSAGSLKLDILRTTLIDGTMRVLLTGRPDPWPEQGGLTDDERARLEAAAEEVYRLVDALMEGTQERASLTAAIVAAAGVGHDRADDWADNKGRTKRRPPARDALIALLDDHPEQWDAFREHAVIPHQLIQEADQISIAQMVQIFLATEVGLVDRITQLPDHELQAIVDACYATVDEWGTPTPPRFAVTVATLRVAAKKRVKALAKMNPPRVPADLDDFLRRLARMITRQDEDDPEVRLLLQLWMRNRERWAWFALYKEENRRRRDLMAGELSGAAEVKVLNLIDRIRLGMDDSRMFTFRAKQIIQMVQADITDQHVDKSLDEHGERVWTAWLFSYSDYGPVTTYKGDTVESDSGEPMIVTKHVVAASHLQDPTVLPKDEVLELVKRSNRQQRGLYRISDAFGAEVSTVSQMLPGIAHDAIGAWVTGVKVAEANAFRKRSRDAYAQYRGKKTQAGTPSTTEEGWRYTVVPTQSLREFLTYLPRFFILNDKEITYWDDLLASRRTGKESRLLRDMRISCHTYLKSKKMSVGEKRIQTIFESAWDRLVGATERSAEEC